MSNASAEKAPIRLWYQEVNEWRWGPTMPAAQSTTATLEQAQPAPEPSENRNAHKGTFNPEEWLRKTADVRAAAAARTGRWAPKNKRAQQVRTAGTSPAYKPVAARGAAAPRPLDAPTVGTHKPQGNVPSPTFPTSVNYSNGGGEAPGAALPPLLYSVPYRADSGSSPRSSSGGLLPVLGGFRADEPDAPVGDALGGSAESPDGVVLYPARPRQLHHVLYGCAFSATQARSMQPLRGLPDTLFRMLNWRFGLTGPAVLTLHAELLRWLRRTKAVRKPGAYLTALQTIFYAVAQARAESLYHGKRCVVGYLSHPKSFTKKDGAIDMPGHAVFTETLQFLSESGYITDDKSPGNLRCSFFEPGRRFPAFTQQLAQLVLSRKGLVEVRTPYRNERYVAALWDPIAKKSMKVQKYRRVGHDLVDPKDYTPAQALHIQAVTRRLEAINDHAFRHSYHVVQRGEFAEQYAGKAMCHVVYNDLLTASTFRHSPAFSAYPSAAVSDAVQPGPPPCLPPAPRPRAAGTNSLQS